MSEDFNNLDDPKNAAHSKESPFEKQQPATSGHAEINGISAPEEMIIGNSEKKKTAEFDAVAPWPMPGASECVFYHAMRYPDGETIDGTWDIRDLFDQYIGHYPISGKTVLDVGTAGGFLAFEAERAGAEVTTLDAAHGSDFDRIHFKESLYDVDRSAHDAQAEAWLKTLKNGFWYSWHRYRSNVEVIYAPLARLPYWDRQFDIVIAGAILEHLADPVGVIGNLARLAREAVIIAFTPVAEADAQFMETANDWSDPIHSFTFWTLSRGLYKRVFANLGFTIEFVPAQARFREVTLSRPTIVARRLDPKRGYFESQVVDLLAKLADNTALLDQVTQQAAAAEQKAASFEREMEALRVDKIEKSQRIASLEAERSALLASTSWRLSAPVRWVKAATLRKLA